MGEATIAVDLLNPGQVLGCIGLMEAAEVFFGGVRAGFDWRGATTGFKLEAALADNPIAAVIGFLKSARATALVPANCEHTTDKWKLPSERLPDDAPYAYPSPDSPATLAVRLDGEVARRKASLTIDYWGDHLLTTQRDPLKLWGGAGGYPGAALANDALELIGEADESDPFAHRAPQSSAFRLDWRRDYIPIDAGFSPNEHGSLSMVGYPLVELLAAIGLTYARPVRDDRLAFRYGVIGGRTYAPSFMRAALGGGELPFPMRSFQMQLGWTGQEGKERCITIVTEDYKR